jgi:carbamoyl-phosphate synthase small subunit
VGQNFYLKYSKALTVNVTTLLGLFEEVRTLKKYLTLENGDVFVGEACGDLGAEIDGELVFTTSMTGYQETLTDPSYKKQIITFTYPLIGNYGISLGTNQSDTVQAAAVCC